MIKMKLIKFNTFREYAIFFWLVLICIIGIVVSKIHTTTLIEKNIKFNSTFNNIYFKKTFKEVTKNLEPRFTYIEYLSKTGDNYQTIINKLNIKDIEKIDILSAIKNQKSLKILKINQKFFFKIDNLSEVKVIEFKIETDKKNEIIFTRSKNNEKFNYKTIKKNFKKELVYKETLITKSLYSNAVDVGISPNIIIEFARLYGFQIDFQRDIWKGDSFQIIYEEYVNENKEIVDNGEIIFANLNLQNVDYQLYKHEYEKNKIDYFDENGKSVKKTLMKTPINGARLSSSFGKRKHPILGYTKMHTGTDFAAPQGTPIMASGDGKVMKAGWCGGGGNCVKIKHTILIKQFMHTCLNLVVELKRVLELNKGKLLDT